METILIKSGSFVLIIALGYFFRKAGYVKRSDAMVFSTIIMKITLPLTIVGNSGTFTVSADVFLIILFAIIVSLILSFIGRFAFKGGPANLQTTAMINCSGYNIGNLTLAFVLAFYPMSVQYLSMFDIGNSLLCLGGTFAIASSLYDTAKKGIDFRIAIRTMLRSVPLITYFILLVMSIFQLQIPSMITQLITPISQANIFLVMFMIGMILDLNMEKNSLGIILKILFIRITGAIVFSAFFWLATPFERVAKEIITICLFSSCTSIAPIYSKKLGDNTSVPPLLNSISILVAIVLTSILILIFKDL